MKSMKRRLLIALLRLGWKLVVSRQRAVQYTTFGIGPIPKGLGRVQARRNDQTMRRFIGFFVLPVWLAAGFLDYIMHRRTKIETTTGLSESLMHTLMMLEAGPAVF